MGQRKGVREPKDFPRRVLEAIHIRTAKPRLNRDKGLEIDPVWDNLLLPKDRPGGRKIHHRDVILTSMTSSEVSISQQVHLRAVTSADDAGWSGESAPVSVNQSSVEV